MINEIEGGTMGLFIWDVIGIILFIGVIGLCIKQLTMTK